jgi:fatty acid desaturase
LRDLDARAIGADLRAMRREVETTLSADDWRHLRKIERWGRACSVLGYVTAWLLPNPISAALISQGAFTRWSMVTHHVMHRGYDRAPGVPRRYTSKRFARGWRRFKDWLDWIVPEAWDHEHNTFHHAFTGELNDPDLVERNIDFLRSWRGPTPLKAAFLVFLMCTWKLLYYAPNTTWLLRRVEARRRRESPHRGSLRSVVPDDHQPVSTLSLLLPFNEAGRDHWKRALLPCGLIRFVVMPLLFLPLGPWAALSVLVNLLLAEVIGNVHSFLTIVPSHAAADLYRFTTPATDRDDFCVRQILTTANYRCGGDFNDFFHGWLNYQIEHHLWPDLTLLQYRTVQPRVRELCAKHGIPYVQEGVFRRFSKLWRVLMGVDSMRIRDPRLAPTRVLSASEWTNESTFLAKGP